MTFWTKSSRFQQSTLFKFEKKSFKRKFTKKKFKKICSFRKICKKKLNLICNTTRIDVKTCSNVVERVDNCRLSSKELVVVHLFGFSANFVEICFDFERRIHSFGGNRRLNSFRLANVIVSKKKLSIQIALLVFVLSFKIIID